MKTLTILCAILMGSLSAHAQDYPVKPIRLLVGFAPGGVADYVARVVSDSLGKVLGAAALPSQIFGIFRKLIRPQRNKIMRKQLYI